MITAKDLKNIIKSAEDEYRNIIQGLVGEIPQFECGFEDGIYYITQELNYLIDRENSRSKFSELIGKVKWVENIDVSMEYIKNIITHFDSEADYDDIQFILISVKDSNNHITEHYYWQLETIVRDAILTVLESYL